MSGAFYKVDSEEAEWNSERVFEDGNMAHRPGVKGGYFPVPPVDSLMDLRAAMCWRWRRWACPVEVHHHEVATAGQCEIGTKFNTLVQRADWNQILKYCVHNVAARLRQDRHLHAQAPGRRQRQRHARAPVPGKDGRTSSPATSTAACPRPPCTTSAASSSTPAR
jgi:hypothetical protein